MTAGILSGTKLEPGRNQPPRPGGGVASQNFRWIQVGGGPSQNTGRGSHIEAQILLFFKEIIKDEFAQEVWVQRVVDHLRPSELDRGVGWVPRVSAGPAKRGGDSRGQLWAGRGLSDSPPATPGWPGSACKAPPLQEGVGAGRKDIRSVCTLSPLLSPQSLPHTKFLPAPPWCRLLGSDLEKVSRSSRFLEKATDRRTKGRSF